ncbi:MAG: hypothetical protein LBR74_05610 [Eubacterium sp.]|jgi:hypothetical protein|nr:hypothetical protein [Eubacterium sp.]
MLIAIIVMFTIIIFLMFCRVLGEWRKIIKKLRDLPLLYFRYRKIGRLKKYFFIYGIFFFVAVIAISLLFFFGNYLQLLSFVILLYTAITPYYILKALFPYYKEKANALADKDAAPEEIKRYENFVLWSWKLQYGPLWLITSICIGGPTTLTFSSIVAVLSVSQAWVRVAISLLFCFFMVVAESFLYSDFRFSFHQCKKGDA